MEMVDQLADRSEIILAELAVRDMQPDTISKADGKTRHTFSLNDGDDYHLPDRFNLEASRMAAKGGVVAGLVLVVWSIVASFITSYAFLIGLISVMAALYCLKSAKKWLAWSAPLLGLTGVMWNVLLVAGPFVQKTGSCPARLRTGNPNC